MSNTKPTENKKPTFWIILCLLQLAIIGGLAYMLVTKNKEAENLQTNLTETTNNLESTSSELFEVRDRLMETKKKYEALGIQNEELDAKIAEMDKYVEKLKNNLNASEADKKNLKKFISNLKADLDKKDEEIKTLMAKNDSLNIEIDTLNMEKTQLGEELETVSVARDVLDEYIKIASVLHVNELKVTALKASGKEFEREEYRAKSIDRIKITYKLSDNKAAVKDIKKFFVQLVLPSGSIFSDANNGGGTTILNDSTEVKYTMAQNLQFNNTGQEMTFTMLKGFNYTPGNYIVNVMCEGEKIGSGYFNVK